MKTAKKQLLSRVSYLKMHKDHLTIDADTHISDTNAIDPALKGKMQSTDNYYHGKPISAEDLIDEMIMAEVDMALIWQNPAATIYPGDESGNYEALYAANKYIYDSAVKYPEKFIPAGWTDPKALSVDDAKKLAEICVKDFGFCFVKMNPAQNKFPIDSDIVMEMVDFIVSLGATPAFHYGADTPFTPPAGLERVARHIAPHPVIGIHMGGGGAGYVEAEEMYIKTREMGLKNPNIKFIQSAKRDTHIESDFITYQLAGKPFSQNIFCASDAPYGRQTWNFGGYRQMFKSLIDGKRHTDKRLNMDSNLFDKYEVQNFMGRSFANLVIESCERTIEKSV